MFRQGVAIMVINDKSQVLLCKRVETVPDGWQCPQGGIDENENIEDAMRRELREETGITSIEVLKKMDKKTRYLFLEETKENSLKLNKYEGQEHVWFLVKFTGDESEIDFETHPEEIEFSDYKWVEPKGVEKHIVSFRKECYKQAMKEFFNV